MSIVTRGLSAPDTLMPSFGLGIGVSAIIVIPVEQVQSVRETLLSLGIDEVRVSTVVVDNQVVAVLEFNVTPAVGGLAQITSVIDRSLTVGVEEIEMSIQLSEVIQTVELIEVIQSVAAAEPDVLVQVLEVGEDVSVDEAIDKVET